MDNEALNTKLYEKLLPYTRQITKNCAILRNEKSAKKKSTVVNDRAQFSVGTMRSHR